MPLPRGPGGPGGSLYRTEAGLFSPRKRIEPFIPQRQGPLPALFATCTDGLKEAATGSCCSPGPPVAGGAPAGAIGEGQRPDLPLSPQAFGNRPGGLGEARGERGCRRGAHRVAQGLGGEIGARFSTDLHVPPRRTAFQPSGRAHRQTPRRVRGRRRGLRGALLALGFCYRT
jgi:hypothetical protein